MVSLDNLIDFLGVCMTHKNAAGELFFVSDGEDISTAQLAKKLVKALNSRSLLLPIPSGLLRFVLLSLGRRKLAQQLCTDFQINISKATKILGWKPRFSVDVGIQNTLYPYLPRKR